MDHPSVELKLPLDGRVYQLAVPRDVTHFYWEAIGAGTLDQAPVPLDTPQGSKQFAALSKASDRVQWSLSINGESIHVVPEVVKNNGVRKIAWHRPLDPPSLPATVDVHLTTEGTAPTVDGEEIALWSGEGPVIPWGSTAHGSLEIIESEMSASDFPTRTDGMWQRHTVYIPQD